MAHHCWLSILTQQTQQRRCSRKVHTQWRHSLATDTYRTELDKRGNCALPVFRDRRNDCFDIACHPLVQLVSAINILTVILFPWCGALITLLDHYGFYWSFMVLDCPDYCFDSVHLTGLPTIYNVKLKLNPCTKLGVFVQVYPTCLLST